MTSKQASWTSHAIHIGLDHRRIVLLTVAAVALGVYLLRGGLGDMAGAAAASTVIVGPVAGSVAVRDAAAPGEPGRNRHR